jgi:hypothetical protein
MNSESKICQNCKKDFIVEPDDFSFYEKMKVPPPTFCVECSFQRRLTYQNVFSLYKRKDSFSGKDIISIYSQDKDLIVIDQKTWWSDNWNPMNYGINYDFSESFFKQWKKFRDKFPLQSMINSKAVNSEYCNLAEESKNSYLCSASWKVENTHYSNAVNRTKDCIDLQIVQDSEFCYDDLNCDNCNRLFYSQNSNFCIDSYFLYDCKNCTDCFMCSNLRNKSYCLENKQLDKEEYKKIISTFDLGATSFIKEKKEEFKNLKLNSIHKFSIINNSFNVTGNNVNHAKNCHNCFDSSNDIEDCKNIFWAFNRVKSVYNSGPGLAEIENSYEVFDSGVGGSNNLFSNIIYYSNNIEYSFNCYNCSDCFSCLGLRKKQYCIFNKQYTKEEYFELRNKIIEDMNNSPYVNNKGIVYKYGEFFPSEMSPFCYNETFAQNNFPLEKIEILANGYEWKDQEEKNYAITLRSNDIPDNIKNVNDTILDEIIECEHKGVCNDGCYTAFRLIKDELIFYKRFNIPIPHMCYSCRFNEKFKLRNPLKLWNRTCMKEGCTNEFETSYSPDRPEIVYCEKCYQNEVY